MRGSAVYFFAFEIAQEIETSRIAQVLSVRPYPSEIRLGSAFPRDVAIYKPLTVRLDPQTRETPEGEVRFRPVIKVFDVGILSISFTVDFESERLGPLVRFHRLGAHLDREAEELRRRVTEDLRAHLVKPAPRVPAEPYTVFCLEQIDGAGPAAEWGRLHRAEISSLLNEEEDPSRLAEDQLQETFRGVLSYTSDDLAVVDWDAALLVDRSAYFDDVLYVIELANLQLEKFRLLDDRLDAFFLRAYDDLDRYFSRMRLIPIPARILRELRAIRMDVTKMTEEVTHITKFVGDWYLARIHLACKERFHLAQWEATVDQKLLQLDQVYSLAHTDIQTRRMLLLEAIIVALFVLDLILLVGK